MARPDPTTIQCGCGASHTPEHPHFGDQERGGATIWPDDSPNATFDRMDALIESLKVQLADRDAQIALLREVVTQGRRLSRGVRGHDPRYIMEVIDKDFRVALRALDAHQGLTTATAAGERAAVSEPLEEFSPDQIRFWMAGRCSRGCRWSMLESAVEGGAGQPGGGHGAGSRVNLVHFKADLERAADQLPLYWQATRLVFSKQHRYSVWRARWLMAGAPTDGVDQEPLLLPKAFDLACSRMARLLGWESEEGDVRAA